MNPYELPEDVKNTLREKDEKRAAEFVDNMVSALYEEIELIKKMKADGKNPMEISDAFASLGTALIKASGFIEMLGDSHK